MTGGEPYQLFCEALRETQKELGWRVVSDKDNPHFHSKYATHHQVLSSAMPVAAAKGLTLVQRTVLRDDGALFLETTLRHDGGYALTSTWPIPPESSPQKLGSALTYAKRYQAVLLLGLAADDDDDGNAASRPRRQERRPQRRGGGRAPAERPSPPADDPRQPPPDHAHRQNLIAQLNEFHRELGAEAFREAIGGRKPQTTADLENAARAAQHAWEQRLAEQHEYDDADPQYGPDDEETPWSYEDEPPPPSEDEPPPPGQREMPWDKYRTGEEP